MKVRYIVGSQIAFLTAVAMQGCSNEDLAGTLGNASGETVSASAQVSGYFDLGVCAASNAGHSYYIPSTSQVFTCLNGFWTLNVKVSGSTSASTDVSNCTGDVDGAIKYSEDTDTYYQCSNGMWQVMTPADDSSTGEPDVQPDIVEPPSEIEVVPPEAPITGTNTFKDTRDGRKYKFVVIGSQVWMAENLNYAVDDGSSSWCAGGDCDSYGRLYNWPTAQNVCPGGWHLPNDDEYKTLWTYVDENNGSESVETSLKASTVWAVPGTDKFGFAAMPAGYYWSGYSDVGSDAGFWSSSEDHYNQGYDWRLYHGANYDDLGMPKEVGFAVRCLYNGTADELSPSADSETPLPGIVPKDTVVKVMDGDLTAGMVAEGHYISCDGQPFGLEKTYAIGIVADVINCARSGIVLEADVGTSWKMSYKENGREGCEATVTVTGIEYIEVRRVAEIKSCSELPVASSSSEFVEEVSSSDFAEESSSSEKDLDECEIFDCVTTQFLNQEMLAAGQYGKMVDVRDNKLYRTIKIGTQTWVAQNLNYVTVGGNADDKVTSWCLDNDPANCETDGRLYWWSAAMDIDAAYNKSTAGNVNIRGICPEGWHVPTNEEWRILYNYVNSVNGTSSVNAALNSSYAWKRSTSASENVFGFSAIPAGTHSFEFNSNGDFSDPNDKGRASFWSSTQVGYNRSYRWFKDDGNNPYQGYDFYNAISDPKIVAMSVRCIQD